MKNKELASAFMDSHGQSASCVDVPSALKRLEAEIDSGLRGCGGLPMLPSYIDPDRLPALPPDCIAIDIGGTTLRRAQVHWETDGRQILSDVQECPLSRFGFSMDEETFFQKIAEFSGIRRAGLPLAVSYSYNMESLPGPDARMLGWCKELRISNMTGATVAQALRRAAGVKDLPVSVINDSVASMLGCSAGPSGGAGLGIIVGTGFNICTTLPCAQIKTLAIPGQYTGSMVVNTEAGESRAFEPGDFEREVMAHSEDPDAAQAEKQVAGRYLEQTILLSLECARKEGLLNEDFSSLTLPQFGQMASGTGISACIISEAVKRSAKIAAVCLYAFLRRSEAFPYPIKIATEGSVIQKMPLYQDCVKTELALLTGQDAPEFLAASFAGIRGAAKTVSPMPPAV